MSTGLPNLSLRSTTRRGFLLISLLTGVGISGFAVAQPSARSLLQQGLDRFVLGEYRAAISMWQSAVEQLQRQDDRLQQGLGWIYISTAYQHLSDWSQAQHSLDRGMQLVESDSADGPSSLRIRAQALNAQGSLQLALGRVEQALSTWQQAQIEYARAGDRQGQIGSQINQTQALQVLGLNQHAKRVLENLSEHLQSLSDLSLQVTGLQALGTAQRATGQLQVSRETLQRCLDLAADLADPDVSLGIRLELGSTLQNLAIGAFQISDQAEGVKAAAAALSQYEEVLRRSRNPQIQIQAQLNRLNLHLGLLIQSQRPFTPVDPAEDPVVFDPDRHRERIAQLWPQLLEQLSSLPPSRPAFYARIDLAQVWLDLQTIEPSLASEPDRIEDLLRSTVAQARQIEDLPALAYGLGTQGTLYWRSQQLDRAQSLTEQALLVSQSLNAPEVSYLWQRQLGLIALRKGDPVGALAAYSSAYESLQSLRRDLVSVSPSLRFSFRDSVEPVYREYVEVLLTDEQPEPERLRRSREVLESLQLAELNTFFRDSCLDTATISTAPVDLDQVDATAAVLYPIVLSDRLEVILSLPGQPLRSHRVPVPRSEVVEVMSSLRRLVVKLIDPSGFLEPTQQVYEWLIRPIETDLGQAQVGTLVFVLDSLLRNVPMAALYDRQREQFLIQCYDLALTPGLQLLTPQPLATQDLRALTAGLTKARQGFAGLANVAAELEQVKATLPGEQLLDDQFTTLSLSQRLQQSPPPVIHLATHGQFSSRADQTFLVTWDERIDIEILEGLLRTSDPQRSARGVVELLTLSACETASGDNRAALGLAGVAVRAGARSTLASLWSVNDASTSTLMGQFYQILTESSVSKAKALRQAQIHLLEDPKYRHPYFWAPFVLVGNWL